MEKVESTDKTAVTYEPMLAVVDYDKSGLSYSEQINEINKKFRVKPIDELINNWQKLQQKYDELGDTAKTDRNAARFHAKAQTYRDCWKSLMVAYCPDLTKLDVQKLRNTQSDAEFRRMVYNWLNNR